MNAVTLDHVIDSLTLAEIRELVKIAIRDEQPYFVDEDGYLVFRSEADYAAYLGAWPDMLPSEVKACYLDEHGLKVTYSDWEPTPEKEKELEEARRQAVEGKTVRWQKVAQELGLE